MSETFCWKKFDVWYFQWFVSRRIFISFFTFFWFSRNFIGSAALLEDGMNKKLCLLIGFSPNYFRTNPKMKVNCKIPPYLFGNLGSCFKLVDKLTSNEYAGFSNLSFLLNNTSSFSPFCAYSVCFYSTARGTPLLNFQIIRRDAPSQSTWLRTLKESRDMSDSCDESRWIQSSFERNAY